ncbi:MAG: ferritin-like domain-containing protein [Bacteroidia bacterium]
MKKNTTFNPVRPGSSERSLLRQFFISELKDIYWAEKHLLKALPKMGRAATTKPLLRAFANHLEVTEKQVRMLEDIFALLTEKAQAKKCEAIEGITREAETIIGETSEGTLTRDVGLIFAAQKVEHYEIATYGGLAQLARTLGEFEVSERLEQILEQEKEADETLTLIAVEFINEKALMEVSELEDADE